MPSIELIAAMGPYNEELINAGIMLAGDGFKPTSQDARVTFDGDSRTIVNGPFDNPNELVAGYWILSRRTSSRRLPRNSGTGNPSSATGHRANNPRRRAGQVDGCAQRG